MWRCPKPTISSVWVQSKSSTLYYVCDQFCQTHAFYIKICLFQKTSCLKFRFTFLDLILFILFFWLNSLQSRQQRLSYRSFVSCAQLILLLLDLNHCPFWILIARLGIIFHHAISTTAWYVVFWTNIEFLSFYVGKELDWLMTLAQIWHFSDHLQHLTIYLPSVLGKALVTKLLSYMSKWFVQLLFVKVSN